MSRFIRQGSYADNAYVEFSFESSLRKYEKQPTKKVKCDVVCQVCQLHHRRAENSPFTQRGQLLSRGKLVKDQENTLERGYSKDRGYSKEKLSESRSLKLSKEKALRERQSNHKQRDHCVSVRVQICKKGEGTGERVKSEMEDEVFLNDFEPSQRMSEEKEGVGDEDFGNIEILSKPTVEKDIGISAVKEKASQEMEQSSLGVEKEIEGMVTPFNENMEEEQPISTYKQDELIEELKEEQEVVEPIIQEPRVQQQLVNFIEEQPEIHQQENFHHQMSIQKPITQLFDINQLVDIEIVIKNIENPIPHLISLPKQQKPQQIKEEQPEIIVSSSKNEQVYTVTADVPLPFTEDFSIYSNSQPIQHEMHQSIPDKCLAFQGGRLYIDSCGQKFYISVRVFNQLLRKYPLPSQLIGVLIQQRPYLESMRSQLQHELQQYLSNCP